MSEECCKENVDGSINYKLLRECLCRVFASSCPEVCLLNLDEDGFLEFYVLHRKLGLTAPMIKKYYDSILSIPFANIVGEFLVRENVNKFVCVLTSFSQDEYSYKVNKAIHGSFGIRMVDKKVIFKFHVNLIQKIMNENFLFMANEVSG